MKTMKTLAVYTIRTLYYLGYLALLYGFLVLLNYLFYILGMDPSCWSGGYYSCGE